MGKPKTSRSLVYSFSVSDSVSWNKYIAEMTGGTKCIGSPVFFFFKIGTTQLVDVSQMANLDELTRVAKAYHLKISVVGAADSATGNDGINNPLSKSRAAYITQQLMVRGIDKYMIISKSEGGIDEYSPIAANRHTAVRLFARQMCFTIIHTISGNLQNNDYQKKESVREEWTLSAIGYFVLSPVARSCL